MKCHSKRSLSSGAAWICALGEVERSWASRRMRRSVGLRVEVEVVVDIVLRIWGAVKNKSERRSLSHIEAWGDVSGCMIRIQHRYKLEVKVVNSPVIDKPYEGGPSSFLKRVHSNLHVAFLCLIFHCTNTIH